MMINKLMTYFILFSVIFSVGALFFSSPVYSQESSQSICCEETTSGFFCQNVPSTECKDGAREAPTSCESTSYCKQGYCFNPNEGTCLDNTPEIVCNANGGIWSEEKPPQCNLGCCVLGDQAAFVTLTRCKAISSELGVQTNYRTDITNEQSCVLETVNQEKGACVYNFEYERTCEFTTREECNPKDNPDKEFFPGKLCTSEELNTNCGPTERTTCISGKEEVYFVDTCGNPANIYDSSKVDDKEYWNNIKDKDESCNPGSANADSRSCGNCNYLQGSFCRESEITGTRADYGGYICADLNCIDDKGQERLHGESWCVYTDEGNTDSSDNSVGSRFFRQVCNNGEIVEEGCEDYRNEVCLEDDINGFSQAACRVNRWQDCTVQDNQEDCENTDRRDCAWFGGEFDTVLSAEEDPVTGNIERNEGICVPLNTPGLDFWAGESSQEICATGNAQCVVEFEKGLFSNGETCTKNCECLEQGWERQHSEICSALGDCGAKINWVGDKGYKKGYNVSITNI